MKTLEEARRDLVVAAVSMTISEGSFKDEPRMDYDEVQIDKDELATFREAQETYNAVVAATPREKRIPASRLVAEEWVKLGEAAGILRAVDLIKTWSIEKGGFTELAHQLTEMAKGDGVSIRECKKILEVFE